MTKILNKYYFLEHNMNELQENHQHTNAKLLESQSEVEGHKNTIKQLRMFLCLFF